MPAITDKALEESLNGVDAKFSDAHKNLDEIARSVATFQFSTDDLRNRLNALALRVKEQKAFLALYLKTDKNNRASLFYKQVSTTAK
jgi:septal ring factor EnvC (AmiA/AmiB activator)